MLIHERQEQTRIKAAAQENSNWNIAQQMPLDRIFVEIEEFLDGFFLFLWCLKRSWHEVVPALFPAFAFFRDEHRAGRQFTHIP